MLRKQYAELLIKIMPLLLLLVAVVCHSTNFAKSYNVSSPEGSLENLFRLPISFTENRGQFDEKTLFKADADGAAFYFCQGEVACLFTRDTKEIIEDDFEGMNVPDHFRRRRYKKEGLIVRTQFLSANPNADVIGINRLSYNNNYFLGNDPGKWYTDVPNYSEIVYKDIYAGIDLKYYGSSGSMKYDFIIHPGADPSRIMIRYEGVSDLRLANNGNLEIETTFGQLYEKSPQIYQEIKGETYEISGQFQIMGPGIFGFTIRDSYDRSSALIIDPQFIYGSYLGGSSADQGTGVAVDGAGAVYILGSTSSPDFPTENPFQSEYGENWDVFLTKISPYDNSFIYSTYIGGGYIDEAGDIAVDSNGHAYITGKTQSSDFPTVNAIDDDYGGGFSGDAFVAKISSLGNSLLFSTYLGGFESDNGWDIALGKQGNIYVTGMTLSSDFPTANPFDGDFNGDSDVFITRLSAAGDSLIYSTFLGGFESEVGWGIAVDTVGNAYIAGWTSSSDLPLVNPYDEFYHGHRDGFVSKLATSGDSLIYCTYLGGNHEDGAFSIAVNPNGNAYVTGYTHSIDFPQTNAFDSSYNGLNDAFIAKLSQSGNSLEYCTFFGGPLDEMGWSIALDSFGNTYITGATFSGNIPLENPFDETYNDLGDAFVMKLSESGLILMYSTYIGGEAWDEGHDIAINGYGKIFVTGKTKSVNRFPAINGFDNDFNGGLWDGFVIKFDEELYIFTYVWPGDLDNNGIVEAADILPLVEFWNETGPSRGIIDYGWYEHEAQEWDMLPATFADADGSGRVDIRDFFPICLNWASVHDAVVLAPSFANDFDVEANREVIELIYEQVRHSQSGPQFEIKRFIENLLSISFPSRFVLQQSYPNPFNASVSIAYEVPTESRITIEIYNIIGQRVKVLVDKAHNRGAYNIIWDGKDESGNQVSSGIYLYRLGTSEYSLIRKMVLLK